MSPRFLWYGAKFGVGYFVLFFPINRGFRGVPRQISPRLPAGDLYSIMRCTECNRGRAQVVPASALESRPRPRHINDLRRKTQTAAQIGIKRE